MKSVENIRHESKVTIFEGIVCFDVDRKFGLNRYFF